MLTRRDLLGRFTVLFGGRLFGAAAMFAANLLIARSLGADSLGEFALLVSGIGLLSVLLGAGFNRIGTIVAAGAAETEGLGRVAGFLRAAGLHIAVGLAASFVVLAILMSFGVTLPAGLAGGVLAIVGATGVAALYLLSSIMVGFNRQVPGVLPDALIRPATFLASVVLLVSMRDAPGVSAVAALYVATIWTGVAAVALLSRRHWQRIARAEPRQRPDGWRRAAYPWAAISFSWDYLIDVLVIIAGLVSGRLDVAILYVCFRFSTLVGFGIKSILSLFLPDMAAAAAKGETGRMAGPLMRANLMSLAFVALAAVTFALAGRHLLGLFGEDMADSALALVLVALAFAPAALFGPAPQILAIFNRHLVSAAVMGLGMAAAAAMTIVLMPHLGVTGGAGAYLVANTIVHAALWWHLRQRTGFDSSIVGAVVKSTPGASRAAPPAKALGDMSGPR